MKFNITLKTFLVYSKEYVLSLIMAYTPILHSTIFNLHILYIFIMHLLNIIYCLHVFNYVFNEQLIKVI